MNAAGAARTIARIRALRTAIGIVAAALCLYVGWSIWARRPPARAQRLPDPQVEEEDSAGKTVQSLDRFEFSSTLAGRPGYTIAADHLRGIEGGLHLLDGIRSVDIARPDGTSLRGTAARGNYIEDQPHSDRAKGRLVLEGAVRLDGPGGERLESDRMEYSQAEGKLVSPGRTVLAIKELSGEVGRLEYDLDAKTVRAEGGVTLRSQPPGEAETVITADALRAAIDGSSADLEGHVRLEREGDWLEAPAMHIERPEGGEAPTRFSFTSKVRGRLAAALGGAGSVAKPPDSQTPVTSSHAGRDRSSPPRPAYLAADRIEGTLEPGGGRSLTLAGAASIREQTDPGGLPSRSLAADRIEMSEAGAHGARTVRAEGAVQAALPVPAGDKGGQAVPASIQCAKLSAVLSPSGALSEGSAEGGVRIESADRIATADRIQFPDETKAKLRGGRPTLREGQRLLVADEIDTDSAAGTVDARGAVRTRFLPEDAGRTATGPGLFSPGEPVDVASDRAALRRADRGGEFSGHVVARQDDRALSAATLRFRDSDRSATAEGRVSARTFRIEGRGPAQARVPVQIVSDSLAYDGNASIARFAGSAVYTEPGRTLHADTITTKNSAEPSEATAEGHVLFEGEGRKGTADRALYRSADRTVTLEGLERPAQVLERATGRSWRGPSLTWPLTADSIPVVSGGVGRSTVVGAVPPSGRESVGKQAVGRKPR